MRRDLAYLVEAGAALGFATLCSFPAVTALVSQLRTPSPKKTVYEDKDGKSTPEATAAFSNKWPKAFVLFAAVVGFGTSTATSIAASTFLTHEHKHPLFLENWLLTTAWVCRTLPRRSLDLV